MSYDVIISPKARLDLKNIALYIANDNVVRARSFTKELKQYFEDRLQNMPLSGRVIKGDIRMIPYKRYNTLYMVNEAQKRVFVLHIFAGAMDWESYI